AAGDHVLAVRRKADGVHGVGMTLESRGNQWMRRGVIGSRGEGDCEETTHEEQRQNPWQMSRHVHYLRERDESQAGASVPAHRDGWRGLAAQRVRGTRAWPLNE